MIELTESYVTADAESKAKEFIKIDKNQIRKFYDDFKLIERKLDENQNANNDWFKKEILPHIKFVKSKIAYSAGRKSANGYLVTPVFKEYMDKQISAINTISDFKVFLMHYQAIIAYYTYHSEFKDKAQQSKGSK